MGLLIWTVAAALGVAALVRESAVAFTVLNVTGAVYLIWLGAQALLAARRRSGHAMFGAEGGGRHVGSALGFRQGLFSNLANPKIAVCGSWRTRWSRRGSRTSSAGRASRRRSTGLVLIGLGLRLAVEPRP